MNNEKEAETLHTSDPVEKPLKVVEGEGSGGELKVVEKKKIFFFGQPGCLKHSPIKTVSTENHNNHSNAAKSLSSLSFKNEETKIDETEKKDAVASDDEVDLLKKISEVLDDEAEKRETEDPTTSSKSNETPINVDLKKPEASNITNETTSCDTAEPTGAKTESEKVNDSQLNNEEKSENKIESEETKKSFEHRSTDESTSSEKIENEKATSEVISNDSKLEDSFESNLKNIQEKQSISVEVEEIKDEINVDSKPAISVPSKLISIVPYDEDSTSSSSQIDTEQEKEVSAVDTKIIVKPQLVESASLISENEEVIDVKVAENVAAERQEISSQEVFEAVESSNKDESKQMPETVDDSTKNIEPIEKNCFDMKKDTSVENDANEITNETETEKQIASDTPSNVNDLEKTENEPETSKAIEIKSEKSSKKDPELVKEELQETVEHIAIDNIVDKKPLSEVAVKKIPEETLNDITVHGNDNDQEQQEETDNVNINNDGDDDLKEPTLLIVKDDDHVGNVHTSDTLNLEKSSREKVLETEMVVEKSEQQKCDIKIIEEPEKTHEKSIETEDINLEKSEEDHKSLCSYDEENASEKTTQQIEASGSTPFLKSPVELDDKQIEPESHFLKEKNEVDHSSVVKEVLTTNDAKNYDSVRLESIKISNNKSVADLVNNEDNFTMERTKDLSLEKSLSHQEHESEANVSVEIVSKKRKFHLTESQKILPETDEHRSASREVILEPKEVLSESQEVLSKSKLLPSKPEEVLCKPRGVLPKPKENLSKTEKDLSKPEENLSKQEENLSKPEKVFSKPEKVLPKPEENLLIPEKDLSKSEKVLPKPEENISKPEKVLSKPEENPSKPEICLSKPEEALSKPENVLSKPEKVFSIPEKVIIEPQEIKLQQEVLPESNTIAAYQSISERAEICGTEVNKPAEHLETKRTVAETHQLISERGTEESKTAQVDVIKASHHLEEKNLITDKIDHLQSEKQSDQASSYLENQVEKPTKLNSKDEEVVKTSNLASSEQNILKKTQTQEVDNLTNTPLTSDTDEPTEISVNLSTNEQNIVNQPEEAKFSIANETKNMHGDEDFDSLDDEGSVLDDGNYSDREDSDGSNDEELLVTAEKSEDVAKPDKLNLPKADSKLVQLAENSKALEAEPSKKIQTPDKNCVKSTEILILNASSHETKVDSNDIVPPKLKQETILTPEKQNSEEDLEKVEKEIKVPEKFCKPLVTRKRKISERKSLSESDSEGNNITDTVSHDNSSEDEEAVQKKKPRMRGKTTSPRKVLPKRAVTKKIAEEEKKVEPKVEAKVVEKLRQTTPEKKDTDSKETLQSLKFDYDGSEDVAANVAAIKTMICKDAGIKKETTSEMSEDEELDRKFSNRRGRKIKRGRTGRSNDAESSSDEDPLKQTSKTDLKRSKTSENSKTTSPNKKKRETGLLKHLDKSLVIDTTDEAPVRQSRRIAQQKIREETERRQMEEKLLKQMKAKVQNKSGPGEVSEEEEAYEEEDQDQKDSSGEDESFKESKKKRKSKIPVADKQWQTSSSHSEHSESEDYMDHHVPSDPGSPLFKSDHEFSPESDDEDTAQVQPVKRARTAKKLEAVASSDNEEDINPKHACQVCHKTDSPEWILLCDECDCGYHCSCLKPIIFLIPSGNWFCPLCCHKKLIVNLSDQLSQLDTLIYNIETAELKRQRQQLAEITEQNIIQERKKNKAERATKSKEKTPDSKGSSESGDESDDSSDDEPLKYKLRKRNQTAAPSYRFNEYDDLINSAIKRDEIKGAGNLGRGKDISTIIEAGDEEKKDDEDAEEDEKAEKEIKPTKDEDGESSGSDVIRPKKIFKKKKKKLNNLDVSSEEERVSDADFKGTSSSDSEVDEEDLSMSSVSESSLDLPSKKKNKGRNTRTLRNREKRTDRRFINDNSNSDSDDEPLIKAKRSKKKESDEEEFDVNDDDDDEGSLAEEIDSEDLCDDTETDSSSEGNWPKKKKKRVASYDTKPRKAPKKKDENEDKAFRAGISKKKVLKKSENESEGSASDNEKGKRKTRGKKLLYLIEDDLDSDESDGIKPGVKRPETPPEEREMFFKKQEEIKRMLAAKDTEAAKKLAAPTIQPIHIAIEKPKSPSLPFSNEPASLSTIPKNVIESAKALDTDYNRIVKPIAFGSQSKSCEGNLQSNDMNEEELARMMEEEDFAQHQLKLAGEAIARKKLLDLEAKEGDFAAYSKVNKEKEFSPVAENKKRSRKPKSAEKPNQEFSPFAKALSNPQGPPPNLTSSPMPPLISSNLSQLPPRPLMQQHPPPSLIANMMQQHQRHVQPHVPISANMMNERPSVLSSFMTRPDMHPQHLKIHQPIPPEAFNSKIQPLPSQQQFDESDEKKKGRRKKFTPLRTDLPEGNISKLAKLDPSSVIQSVPNPSDRVEDKNKVPRTDLPKLAVAAPPQIFNPATTPTPSVITRLLQPQRPGPYPQGFSEIGQPGAENPNIRMYPSQEDIKNMSPNKARGPMPQTPPTSLANLPPAAFGEHPAFGPRAIHPLYRGPTPYGIPPHARLPPYPFHHLHPANLRPGEYSAPYNIPPQFSYYAPPAHSRQPSQTSATTLNHGAPQHVAGNEDISNSIRNANNPQEPGETGGSSEFGGLINFFNSQQELD